MSFCSKLEVTGSLLTRRNSWETMEILITMLDQQKSLPLLNNVIHMKVWRKSYSVKTYTIGIFSDHVQKQQLSRASGLFDVSLID